MEIHLISLSRVFFLLPFAIKSYISPSLLCAHIDKCAHTGVMQVKFPPDAEET